MKKITVTALLCLFIHNVSFSQDVKFDNMNSASGRIVKYIDLAMPKIQVDGALLSQLISSPLDLDSRGKIYDIETRIRYSYNDDEMYCCLIHKEGILIHTEVICYEELVQINKALQRLLKESESDVKIQPPHLTNEYITSKGVSIGYSVEGSSVNWYIDFGNKTVKDKIYIKKGIAMIDIFQSIQKKMEELSK